MRAEGELVNGRSLAAQVEDADLGVGNTAVEARLPVIEGSMFQRILLCTPSLSVQATYGNGLFYKEDKCLVESAGVLSESAIPSCAPCNICNIWRVGVPSLRFYLEGNGGGTRPG